MGSRRGNSFQPVRQSISKAPIAPAPSTAELLLQKAVAHHRAGELPLAEAIYRRVLQLSPDHPDALYLLGIMAYSVGNFALSLELIDKVLRINPRNAEAFSNRGSALFRLQRYQAAVESYDQAIQLDPNYAEAYCNRSSALYVLEHYQAALESAEKAILLRPNYPEAYGNRGNALGGLKHYEAALENYDQAIRLKPNNAEALSNRGNALLELGRCQAALESCDKAIAIDPNYAEAYSNRGNVLHRLERYQAALESCDRAVALNPADAEAQINRGNALLGLRRYEAAIECYDKAIELKPHSAGAHSNRGSAFSDIHQYETALTCFDQAIRLNPEFADAYINRGNAFYGLHQYEAALASYDKAIGIQPDHADAQADRANALLGLRRYEAALASFNAALRLNPAQAYLSGMQYYMKQFLCDWEGLGALRTSLEARIEQEEKAVMPFAFLSMFDSVALQKKAAEIYVHDKCPPCTSATFAPLRRRHDKIRIGYFSGNFYNHAICYLMAELFEKHDRNKFEVIGFSFGPPVQDAMRERVIASMDRFVDVRSMSNKSVAELSRELELDIAVDLMGHTEGSRSGIFAERAAPVQVNYLGYPGTMGASYIDYILADKILIPEATRQHYSEKVIYLPDCFQANASGHRISDKPCSRAAEGLPENHFVFCCFNNNYKIAPEIFDIWMRILGRVEGSVLWLLGEERLVCDHLRSEAARRGIAPERLVFAHGLPLAEHMARQRLADLFLDTLPFNAGATASPALWAGLPILTRTGESFSGRMATSLLYAVGMPELITTTEAEYEDTAVAIATTPGRAQALKDKLLRNRQTTPLFDLPAFALHIEAAYTAMYERSLAGLAPEHISVERKTRTS